jgi:ABC-2 type transport system ATP-binding protein
MLTVERVEHVYPRATGLRRLLIKGAAGADVPALDDIDLTVRPGEVVGLVGPNGAGKTTLLKIIATLLEATAGIVSVDGFDVRSHPIEVRRRIGLVLADDRALYWRLTGRQNLEFFGVMQGLGWAEASHRAGTLLDWFGLGGRDRMVFGYSSGMRARLSIARAMLARPRLLVLDEPTRALDPIATAEVGHLLRSTAADGVAVLLSSHRLDEIEAVCDRIVAIVGGRVRFDGRINDLAGDARFADALHALLVADESRDAQAIHGHGQI